MKHLAILCCLALPACATTVATAPLTPSALTFSYHPPKTKISVSADLVLVACDPNPVVAMDVSVVGKGTADSSIAFKLDGDSFSSATQKRDLKFELNDDRTLKTLNASSSDRSGAIFANVLKTLATVATAVLAADAKTKGGVRNAPDGSGTESLTCNERTYDALRQAEDLRHAIATQRDLMGQGPPEDATKIRKSIDALAARLSSLVQTELSLTITAPLTIGEGELDATGKPLLREIRWTILDLATWFAEDPAADPCTPRNLSVFYGDGAKMCELQTELLGLNYTVEGDPVDAALRAGRSPCLSTTDPKLRRTCGKTIALVEPVMAKVSVTSAGRAIAVAAGDDVASASVPVAQWGAVTYLPIDVKWMQSRNVGLTFDSFGRKTTFSWVSDATAENATAALSDIATNASSVATALKGKSDLEKLNDENTVLEAEAKNKALKACKAAMDAGATSCP